MPTWRPCCVSTPPQADQPGRAARPPAPRQPRARRAALVRDPSGESGSFVGQQIEMRIRWRILPANLLLELGYAHLFAGEFIGRAPNSNSGDSNYVYTQFVLDSRSRREAR